MINHLIEVIIKWEVELVVVRCLGCFKREQDGVFQLLRVIELRMGEVLLTAHSLDYEHL